MPRLIAGCPIANRSWALPHWFECLAAQTRRPDALVFVLSGSDQDMADMVAAVQGQDFGAWIRRDDRPPHTRHDNTRYEMLASLRNELLWMAFFDDADLFLSLDSDVMLEDPETIERLEQLMDDDGCDIAAPLTFLHMLAPRRWQPGDEACWAYNFGWLAPGPPRSWLKRPHPSTLPWGDKLTMEVPMAVWLGNQRALRCRYEAHESGEDIGFAQSLKAEGLRCVVDTSLYAPHVWSEQHFQGDEWADVR